MKTEEEIQEEHARLKALLPEARTRKDVSATDLAMLRYRVETLEWVLDEAPSTYGGADFLSH